MVETTRGPSGRQLMEIHDERRLQAGVPAHSSASPGERKTSRAAATVTESRAARSVRTEHQEQSMNDQRSASKAIELTKLPIKSQVPPRAARAHVLKNCLAIVSAVNELVECELVAASQRRVARSQRAVRRMAELIEEDLRFDGKTRPECAEFVSAEQVFEAVRAHVEDLAESRRVRLEFVVGPSGIWGDRNALTEALVNIVKNAIESSGDGDTVVVTSMEGAGGGQLWTVRDSGPGIPQAVLVRLGAPIASCKDDGAGLGVAVACDIFDNHGGLLQIESGPGWGTTVSIWIPIVPTA
jgi:signal transduction histidine kinase